MLKNIEANTKMVDLGARQQALEKGERIDGPRGGGVNWAFFKFLKQLNNLNLCNASEAPIHQPDN